MQASRWERFAPLTGVVFLVLVAILFIFSGDTPDADDSTSSVVSYWSDHQDRTVAFALLGSLAALFLVWFAGSLRSALRRAEGGEGRLSTLSFAGALILAVAILIGTSIDLAIADSVGEVPDEVTQALSAYDADFYLPFVGGYILMMLPAGMCVLRSGGLPRWMGWAAVVIGIAGLTLFGSFFGLLAAVIWIGVAGVVLYQGGREAAGPAAPPPPPAAPAP